MDTDTARNITAVGKDSLHHIIGGNPPHLWHKGSLHAPPPTTKNNNNPDSDEHPKESVEDCSGAVGIEGPRSVVGDDDSEASLLLDARLQGGVLLGRAPAIARILTATVPGGGEWVLPRAGPVQVLSRGQDGGGGGYSRRWSFVYIRASPDSQSLFSTLLDVSQKCFTSNVSCLPQISRVEANVYVHVLEPTAFFFAIPGLQVPLYSILRSSPT